MLLCSLLNLVFTRCLLEVQPNTALQRTEQRTWLCLQCYLPPLSFTVRPHTFAMRLHHEKVYKVKNLCICPDGIGIFPLLTKV